jgi:hypothetical protein
MKSFDAHISVNVDSGRSECIGLVIGVRHQLPESSQTPPPLSPKATDVFVGARQ